MEIRLGKTFGITLLLGFLPSCVVPVIREESVEQPSADWSEPILRGWQIFRKYDGDPEVRPEKEYRLVSELAQMADRMKAPEILEYYQTAKEATVTPQFYALEEPEEIVAWFRTLSSYGLNRERGLGLIRLYEDFLKGVYIPYKATGDRVITF